LRLDLTNEKMLAEILERAPAEHQVNR